MAHTEQLPLARAQPAPSDDAFEEVRQSFLLRLHGEQARLVVLTDALASGKCNAALILGDLEIFAHRLRGAAAVFDAGALSEDAKSLELAAAVASIVPVRANDPLLWTTLRTLSSRLASMNDIPLPN